MGEIAALAEAFPGSDASDSDYAPDTDPSDSDDSSQGGIQDGQVHAHRVSTNKKPGRSMASRRKRSGRAKQSFSTFTQEEVKKKSRASLYVPRTQNPNEHLRRKYRSFNRGAAKFGKKLKATADDIRRSHDGLTQELEDAQLGASTITAACNLDASQAEIREIQRTMELLEDGAVGYMPEDKKAGRVRIWFENVNSLCVFTQKWKLSKINNEIIPDLQVDLLLCCETQCDWRMVGPDQQFLRLIQPGLSRKGIAACNTTGRPINRDQVGGTAAVGIGRICDVIREVWADKSGLARWVVLKLTGDTGKTTYVCSSYYSRKSSSTAVRTGWVLSQKYYESIGDFRSPAVIFQEDLLSMIKEWRKGGADVILAIDANQNVYEGDLGRALAMPPFDMSCLVHEATGSPVPNSFHRGTEPITTIFGTPGIVVENAMCYPHYNGVGDHRMYMVEVTASSLFGGDYPKIATPSSRQLNCSIDRTVTQYCKELDVLLKRHNMHAKLERLFALPEGDPSYPSLHNAFDRELGELMMAAEHKCTKFKRSHWECSPIVNLLIKRKLLLRWILRWHDGKVPNTCHLLRAAKIHNIEDALKIPRSEIEARLRHCIEELNDIRIRSPEMRQKFMRQLRQEAYDDGRSSDEEEISRIMKRESDRARQHRINLTVRDPKGRSVAKVQLNDPKETPPDQADYRTREKDIVRECNERLSKRFQLGKRAPASHGDLGDDLGALADTEAARRIVAGTYTFRDDTDYATRKLLTEIARIRVEFEGKVQDTGHITLEEYLVYWKKMDERTSSSYSGRHMGHYKASCNNIHIASLLLASVNLAVQRGLPLDRWKKGVTVLLEKELGNCYIEKLRAICLLEADLNMFLRTIYSRRMIDRMRECDMVPVEQIATKGKTAIEGVMQKQLFYDQSQVTHVNASLSSTDAANCYDAVNHPICSLALQSMMVPMVAIVTYLRCLQTMTFHLKTAFGLSKTGYGGTEDNPFMGLTQGSCASPPVWTAVSTVIVRAYRNEGYGVSMESAWSGLLLVIAAILFVDDTDLLHRCTDFTLTEDQFVNNVNAATHFWASLLQATGGNLKPSKCYYYLMIWKFERGIPRLKTAQELRWMPRCFIPQPFSDDVPITMLDCTEAAETLGVFTCPANTGFAQLDKMMSKAYKWSNRIRTSNLTARECWDSFSGQILMSLYYSLVPLLCPPAVLEETLMDWYYHCLPKLRVNRNITADWRWVPTTYQGLGMPNMGVEKLAQMIHFFLRYWGSTDGMGLQLRMAYELTQVESGLEGNFFSRDLSVFSILVSNTWMRCFWYYQDYYDVLVDVEEMSIPMPRERDQVFMELVVKKCPRDEWVAINRVRKQKKVYFLSQVLAGDGETVLPIMKSPGEGVASRISFPREQPTLADFRCWMSAVRTITSPTLCYSPRLGKYLIPPYDRYLFWCSSDTPTEIIKVKHGDDRGDILVPTQPDRVTRSTNVWIPRERSTDVIPDQYIASVAVFGTAHIVLSYTKTKFDCIHEDWRHLSLRDRLLDMQNVTLWKYLDIGPTGDWIVEAISRGSLVMVHDGSYMEDLAPDVCSAALIIYCTRTGVRGSVTVSERTNVHTASNYRGEGIGAILAGLVVYAATAVGNPSVHKVRVGCDNLGIVIHASDITRSLPEKQSQADVIRCMRNILRKTRGTIKYEHVYGHQDDSKELGALPLMAQLNVAADEMAKIRLLESVDRGDYIQLGFPFEGVSVWCHGIKVHSSIKAEIYRMWGREVARELYANRCIASGATFDLINWDAVGAAMSRFPRMFRVWWCKLVSHFTGTNRMLINYVDEVENTCPNCGEVDEGVEHLTQCLDSGRTEIFEESVYDFVEWLQDTHMDEDLAEGILDYLLHRGSKTMMDLLYDCPHLHEYASEHDRLGWTNFLEGRVSTTLFKLQEESLRDSPRRMKIKTWSGLFLQHLIGITHRQWTYRNAKVHLKKLEGRTEQEHEVIFDEVRQMMLLDPIELLPKHQRLLEVDFAKLGEGTTEDRLRWLDDIDMAIRAKQAVAGVDEDEWVRLRVGLTSDETKQTVLNRRRVRRPPPG